MTWPPHPHGNRAPAPSGPTLPVAGLWLWNNNNKKVSVGTRWTGQTPTMEEPLYLVELALTLVTMMGVWKSLPPVIRKPQGAGPTTSTVSAIPEEEGMERWSLSTGAGERQKGGESVAGPRRSQSGAGGMKEVASSFLRPPVSFPPTLGNHDSEFSSAVRLPAGRRSGCQTGARWGPGGRAGAGRWQGMSALPPLPLLHRQG